MTYLHNNSVTYQPGMADLGQSWSDWFHLDKSGTFSDQISVKYWMICDEKFKDIIPFRANLTHFGAKSDIRGADVEIKTLNDRSISGSVAAGGNLARRMRNFVA